MRSSGLPFIIWAMDSNTPIYDALVAEVNSPNGIRLTGSSTPLRMTTPRPGVKPRRKKKVNA